MPPNYEKVTKTMPGVMVQCLILPMLGANKLIKRTLPTPGTDVTTVGLSPRTARLALYPLPVFISQDLATGPMLVVRHHASKVPTPREDSLVAN